MNSHKGLNLTPQFTLSLKPLAWRGLEKGVRRVEMELKEVLKAWRSATNERGGEGV
jgi:hypothetical protein